MSNVRLVLKSSSWQAGQLRAEFEEPFESLRRSNQLRKTKHNAMAAGRADFQDWLPKNAVLQLFLSTFPNIAGGPVWMRTGPLATISRKHHLRPRFAPD